MSGSAENPVSRPIEPAEGVCGVHKVGGWNLTEAPQSHREKFQRSSPFVEREQRNGYKPLWTEGLTMVLPYSSRSVELHTEVLNVVHVPILSVCN